MFERFTERARQVIVLAEHEARAMKHNYIGSGHLLVALIREEEGIAARVLEDHLIAEVLVRHKVRSTSEPAEKLTTHIPMTPRAKKVLELAFREALTHGHSYIGTEHLLLGLIREGDGTGVQVLEELGGDLMRIRLDVIERLGRPDRLPRMSF